MTAPDDAVASGRASVAIGWLAIALLAQAVAGCAAPTSSMSGYGSSAPAAALTPDPYHYRCTGACRNAG
jgi:hypothetical protein